MSLESAIQPEPFVEQLPRIAAASFRSVLGQLAGFAVTVEVEPGAPVDLPDGLKGPSDVWSIFVAEKAVNGEMAVVCSQAGALVLAQILMSEPIDATRAFDENFRDAYGELLRQVLGQVSTGLKSVVKGEVEIKEAGNTPPVWPGAVPVQLRIGGEKIAPIPMSFVMTEKLLASAQPTAQSRSVPENPAPPAVPAPAEAPPTKSSNLELLLDVNLDASIRFGQKQMLLREILELHPGVAIALDRRIEEPVELLIGGRMVARGEVVIVEGNYGLRVTEIVSPQQRIESLRSPV